VVGPPVRRGALFALVFALVLVLVLTSAPWAAVLSAAQAIAVSRVAGAVRVRAPGVTFIKGEPLDILEDGRPLRIDLELTVLPRAGADGVARDRQTVVLSYDLWEERFAATRVGAPARSAEYLTSAGAEAWCLEQLAVPVSAMGALASQPFWIRLDYRILDGERAGQDDGRGGYTLQSLIDALSRRRKASEWTHSVEAGPFRLQS
jgi:hypothetical protein